MDSTRKSTLPSTSVPCRAMCTRVGARLAGGCSTFPPRVSLAVSCPRERYGAQLVNATLSPFSPLHPSRPRRVLRPPHASSLPVPHHTLCPLRCALSHDPNIATPWEECWEKIVGRPADSSVTGFDETKRFFECYEACTQRMSFPPLSSLPPFLALFHHPSPLTCTSLLDNNDCGGPSCV